MVPYVPDALSAQAVSGRSGLSAQAGGGCPAYVVGQRSQCGGVDPPALPVQVHVLVGGAAAEGDQPAGIEVGQELRLREHSPPQAEADRLVEVGAGGDQVDDVGRGDAAVAEQVVLEAVLGV